MSIPWQDVRRVLVVKLRSIGDTVLTTPSLIALRRFLPDAQVDILLEDWVAPVLDGFSDVDNVIVTGRSFSARTRAAAKLRRTNYDVAFNLHGGSTSTLLTFASGARHRIGVSDHRYSFLYTQMLPSAADFWRRDKTHSVEQQLAVLGHAGVPVKDGPRTRLAVTDDALAAVQERLAGEHINRFALLHPATAYATKRWSAANFAAVAAHLARHGLETVAAGAANERPMLDELAQMCSARLTIVDDMTLPQIIALASLAEVFVGNDSGIAHIAAAVNTPVVVVFGSSNRAHWHPWTDAPFEMVYKGFDCQPCAGYSCTAFAEPRCILEVTAASVIGAIDRVLLERERRALSPPVAV
jgi:heptosyltransferase III